MSARYSTRDETLIDATSRGAMNKATPTKSRKQVSAEELARINQQAYLRITEAAILARVSRQTIYNAIYAGELKALIRGERYIIRRSDLDAWIDYQDSLARYG